MKKFIVAGIALLASGSVAYAAAPDAVHALVKACGMPCC